MPEVHATLSPSAADRWFACPGSVVLSEGLPEKTSPFAEEGTLAHKVAEKILRSEPVTASPDMMEHVRVYTDHIDELFRDGEVRMVEKEVKVNEEVWGTADAIVWVPSTETLYVRDLKYGAGVAVEAEGNLQLKIYALATMLTVKYPAKRINVGIVQPRIPTAGGVIRCAEYDVVDLIEFHQDIKDACARVEKARKFGDLYPTWKQSTKDVDKAAADEWEQNYLNPTDKGCRWCLAAPTCPKLKQKSQELVKQVFSPVCSYDPQELAHTLDTLPILEGWIKNVREFAYEEAEKGNHIPGYKLVDKTPQRKLKDDVLIQMGQAFNCNPLDFYGKPPILGIGELEKMAPGKNAKERAQALEPFVTRVSGGHVLVHESDKRDAIRVDAKAVFTSVPEVDPFS